jgi:hypothetical protein
MFPGLTLVEEKKKKIEYQMIEGFDTPIDWNSYCMKEIEHFIIKYVNVNDRSIKRKKVKEHYRRRTSDNQKIKIKSHHYELRKHSHKLNRKFTILIDYCPKTHLFNERDKYQHFETLKTISDRKEKIEDIKWLIDEEETRSLLKLLEIPSKRIEFKKITDDDFSLDEINVELKIRKK